jgi:hypothetical protein
MEWFPVVFGTIKALVFGTGMFFAIKWHYDQDKKKKEEEANKQKALAEQTSDASE